jgi:hypothetical protein
MSILGVSKKFGEWYQDKNKNKKEDTNKLTIIGL